VSSFNESTGLYPTVPSFVALVSGDDYPARGQKNKVSLVLESSRRTSYMSSDILRPQGVTVLEPAQVRSCNLGLQNPR
jgi:hypothetical protein